MYLSPTDIDDLDNIDGRQHRANGWHNRLGLASNVGTRGVPQRATNNTKTYGKLSGVNDCASIYSRYGRGAGAWTPRGTDGRRLR